MITTLTVIRVIADAFSDGAAEVLGSFKLGWDGPVVGCDGMALLSFLVYRPVYQTPFQHEKSH